MFRRPRIVPLVLSGLVLVFVASPLVHLLVRAALEPAALQRVLRDATSWHLLGRSVLLAAIVALIAVAVGTALAWLTVRPRWPRWVRGALLVLLCAPLAVPSYVAAFGLIAATGSSGALGRCLPEAFSIRDWPLLGSWVVLVCCTCPYVILPVRSVLVRECATMEEAARNLGASGRQAFVRITLPRLVPTMAWGGMLAGLYTLSDFGAVSLMGYETLTWGIYHRYTIAFGLDEARALCLLLIALTVVLIALMWLLKPDLPDPSSAPAVEPTPVRLRWWNIPSMMLVALMLLIGLGVPLLSIAIELGSANDAGAILRGLGPHAVNTLHLSIAAAIIIPLLALPLASLHLGRASRTSRLLTPMTLIGFALPGIVLAIAGAGLALRADALIEWLWNLPMEHRLYQSHIVLLLAYSVLFLPEAAGPLRSGAARIHPEQLDAANQLGGSAWSTWWRIALPQLGSALIAGAALVFVTTAKELPATLVLAPLDVETLATRLWSSMEEAQLAQAAGASLLLLLIAGGGLVLALVVERLWRTER